jgi:hypothetical protein
LDIYLDLSSEGKAIEALVGADIGKNWLSHGKALRVNFSSQFAIHFAGHSLGKVGEFNPDGHPEISFLTASGGQTPQIHGAALTILLLSHIYSVHQTLCIGFFGYAPQPFPLGAQVVVGGLLVMKII